MQSTVMTAAPCRCAVSFPQQSHAIIVCAKRALMAQQAKSQLHSLLLLEHAGISHCRNDAATITASM